MVRKVLIVGGDRRALMLTPLIRKQGFGVATYGLREEDEKDAEIELADVLLFPYPFAVRSGCVPTLSGLTIHPEDVLARAKPGALLLAGRGLEPYVYSQEMAEKNFGFKLYGIEQENAELSAEAALCEAMQRTELALMHMRVLVVGYGLFGRALALRLKMLGAQVCVAARREEVRGRAHAEGMQTVAISELEMVLPQIDLVCNTVPARVIGEKELRMLRPDTWLLELASAPYGFDRDVAKALGLNCEVLPALPARYAPLSAARVLRDAVVKLIREEAK